ncbi:MAG: ABC transporter ATP-binding protein [Peptococcaceae bacterium]|nr:ABC transporter ATP-binding protein [Peptococcaceae bacterium]
MHILQVEGVTKRFGGLEAVSHLDFYVDQGEVIGLIGPNGAGKTTVFNLISGALVPDAGLIKFNGKKINGLKPNQICKAGVARTFQSVKVFPNMTVYQNVLLGSLFGAATGVPSPDAERETLELLDFVGLSTARETPAKDLTLAHQKRLEVARALATKPDLLLFDELMAGLNPTEVTQAMEMVLRIRDQGITILMIEHVMKAIMNVCGRIIVLHHGQKIAEGTPEGIAADKQVIEIYLGEWK